MKTSREKQSCAGMQMLVLGPHTENPAGQGCGILRVSGRTEYLGTVPKQDHEARLESILVKR